MAVRTLTQAVIALQSFLLYDWFVPSLREAIPRNRALRELVERELLWPLRQDVVGRLAGRFAAVGLLSVAATLGAAGKALYLSYPRLTPLLTDAEALIPSGLACLGVVLGLAVFELLVPTHVRRSSVAAYFDGSFRKGNPVGDWLYNALFSVRSARLGEAIGEYVDASRGKNFDSAAQEVFRRIDAAVHNSLKGTNDLPRWDNRVCEEVVGRVSLARSLLHLALYAVGAVGITATLLAFRLEIR